MADGLFFGSCVIRFKRYEKHCVLNLASLECLERMSYVHCTLSYNSICIRLNTKEVSHKKVWADENLVALIMVYIQGGIYHVQSAKLPDL